MTKLSIEKLRKDTPGCHNILHFNNAGASLAPTPVIEAIKNHLDLEASMGGYEAAGSASSKIENFYKAASKLINCTPEEVAFTENATRAWDMAFYSFKFKPGDKILTAVSEYASNYLAFLQVKKYSGAIIEVIKNDAFGQLDIRELQNKIDARVKLIAITHVPTQGGLINPAEAVGKIARNMNIPYLLDTTQSVGQMPIDVKKIGCDFLCATGRKYLRGPRGTGFLYARKEIIAKCDPPFVDLHSATWVKDNDYVLSPTAERFETWEQNIAAKIGLGVAIDYAHQLGLPAIWERIQYLAILLRDQLAKIQSIELHDLGENKCGLVTFSSKSKSPQEIQQHLSKMKINVSISLQEYARLDLSQRKLAALVRASVHYYNTEEEIETFCLNLRTILGY
jgi:cysteine desulfurase/selenocysteine lyase